MDQPNWIKNAYKGTDVHWTRSQGEIQKMLNELGIYDIRFTNMRDKFALEFLVQTEQSKKPRAVRILTPLQHSATDDRMREKELNIAHRMLKNHIRAKFIAVGRGLVEFEREFMAHLLITDKAGNSTTMAEALLPQYESQIENCNGDELKLLN